MIKLVLWAVMLFMFGATFVYFFLAEDWWFVIATACGVLLSLAQLFGTLHQKWEK